MLHYLTTSQVLPGDSFIHRMDPRTRLLGFLGLLTLFVIARHIGPAALTLGATVGLAALARVPFRHTWRGLRLLLPWLLFIGLVQIILGVGNAPACGVLLDWGPLRLTACTLQAVALTLLRFLGLVLLMNLFVWTTTIPELVRGIEGLARPFDRAGLPAHQLALVGVIAVRFVPTMALELERLQKAQAARGADVGGGRIGFVGRVRRTLPLVVPMFVLALQRAERLAEAMEARAYSGGRGRTSYARLHFRRADGLALALLTVFFVWVIRV